MFAYCSGLTSIDMSGIDISHLTEYYAALMFLKCQSLQTVITSTAFPEDSYFNEEWRVLPS
jgi:surface protein